LGRKPAQLDRGWIHIADDAVNVCDDHGLTHRLQNRLGTVTFSLQFHRTLRYRLFQAIGVPPYLVSATSIACPMAVATL
jgi:hypothetical protein